MAHTKPNLKRKASVAEDTEAIHSEDEFGNDGLFEGVLEDESEDGDSSSDGSVDLEDEDANEQDDAESVPTEDNDEEDEKVELNPELEYEDDGPEYTVEEDANGNERYVYREVDPVYDSDDTDAQEPVNTIGNIPLSFYDAYPHIGYDINGKKIMRPATTEALDALLDSIEVPKGYTGLTDPNTGKPLNLSQDELDLIRRVQMADMPENAYPDTVEWFTSFEEQMPLSAAPEPKRRFVPSKHESKRIMKLVKAIREGRILPYKPPEEREEEEEEEVHYDLWKDEQPQLPNIMHIPAPKIAPPGYDLSYNPPPEYLPTETEKKAFQETDPEEREKEYLPEKYDSLRKVPGYSEFVKERFERCLDLYLAPRVRKNRLNIDPSSLLPKLPRPSELKPYPTSTCVEYCGHEGRVRSVSIDPSGQWLASGGEDGTARIFELRTGKQMALVKLSSDEPVDVVRWRPGKDAFILAATVSEDIYFIIPSLVDPDLHQASRDVLDAGFGYAASKGSTITNGAKKDDSPGQWSRAPSRLEEQGVLLKVTVRSPIKALCWHRGGNFFSTVSPSGQKSAVVIHTLSRHLSQRPFRKLSGLAQTALFHPSRPLFFVATQRTIRCYDLSRQELVKVIQPGARWISSFDIHPSGDHLIVASYDRRLAWIDLELSNRPFKTMRFHTEAIRSVRFHPSYPLFADASDDGSIQIMHGKVVNDSTEDATIIPIKMLRGHKIVNKLGVMDITWHPKEPWCVSASSDGTARLWA